MANPEYITPVFIQVQRRQDHIDNVYPLEDSSSRAHFERSKANLHSAIRELISPPRSIPIEIPAEESPHRE